MIAIIAALFIVMYYFVSFNIFNAQLIMGYSTIFTCFPVFSLIMDEDVDVKTALKYPPLYKSL